MKRKMLVLFGVLLVGLAVIFLAVQARGASAQNMTFDEILNAPQGGQNAATQTGAELLTSTATAFPDRMSYRPARGSDPNLVPISLEQVKQNEAVIESAKILIEKADKKYVTAGWLHTVSQEYLRSDLGMGAHVCRMALPPLLMSGKTILGLFWMKRDKPSNMYLFRILAQQQRSRLEHPRTEYWGWRSQLRLPRKSQTKYIWIVGSSKMWNGGKISQRMK